MVGLFGRSIKKHQLVVVNNKDGCKQKQGPLEQSRIVEVFIARPSALGNPFILGVSGTRDEVCDRYDEYLDTKVKQEDPKILAALDKIVDLIEEGKDVHLVCFCKPKRCHGDSVVHQVKRRYHARHRPK